MKQQKLLSLNNKFAGRVALVTGANRGVGKAIVKALLKRDVSKVYATARQIDSRANFSDPRVTPLVLDITNGAQIDFLNAQTTDVDLLINNAGVNGRGSLLTVDLDVVQREMNTNYFGTLDMIRAFYPIIAANGGGNIVNVISICALASMPGLGGYSASKAALFSATQALRTDLAEKNILLHGVFPGPINTDMNAGLNIEMVSPQSVAVAILDGIENGDEDIYPDPIGLQVGQDWLADPKRLEKQFAQYR